MRNTKTDLLADASLTAPAALSPQWGAALIEPATIAALRVEAGGKLIQLGSIAPPKSGIPSRAVRYFTLMEESSRELQADHGLHTQRDRGRLALVRDGQGVLHLLERDSLLPLVRRPSDVGGVVRVPASAYQGSYLFSVPESRAELLASRKTHTLNYIEYGERTNYAAPVGSRRAGGIPSERAQTANRRQWWTVPTMPTTGPRVLLPKARGAHCAPELPENVVTLDNYYYAAPLANLPNPAALSAVLNLSWTHLMAEIFGRRNAGAGALATYIRELSRLPVPNPATMSDIDVERLLEAFEGIASRKQHDIRHELNEPSRQAFDLVGMEILFGDNAEAAVAATSRALRDLAAEREIKAISGQHQARRAAARQGFDARRIAARLADELHAPPSPLSDSELQTGQLGSAVIDVPSHEVIKDLKVEVTLLGTRLLINEGPEPVIELARTGHVRYVAALLAVNRELSGGLVVPTDAEVADETAWRWFKSWEAWQADVTTATEQLLPGANRTMQRERVREELADLYQTAETVRFP